MLALIADFVFPPACCGCALLLEAGSGRTLCDSCASAIARVKDPMCSKCGLPLQHGNSATSLCQPCLQHPPAFRKARSIAQYHARVEDQDVLGSILRRHKYGLNQSLSRTLREIVNGAVPFESIDYDLVIPVPLHLHRLRWRGFNQAALLAAEIGRIINVCVDYTNLVRTKSTTPQTSADSAARRKNVRDAFDVKRPRDLASRNVLVIDDVMTTGATVNECARALISASARNVDVFTLARAL
jgi:ComF family protein